MAEEIAQHPLRTNNFRLDRVPWWVVILAILSLGAALSILTDSFYLDTFAFLLEGVWLSIRITVISYILALVIGLLGGLGRVSTNPLVYAIATLYVEVVRGVPLFVVILYFSFVIAPNIQLGNLLGPDFRTLPDFWSGSIALALGYGAYLSEVYRAGIQSVGKGQIEAARSLGMTGGQTMRYIVLPQAIRVILPPLGNEFIAMLKDSALVSAIGVRDLTQLGRFRVSRTFKTFEVWNAVAILYLMMTLCLSLVVRTIERRSKIG
ncbi:MAG: amino acid ABC transporter permease [Chloroflexi bacterium]|nr:amino acid ABC transporter permease [Chloroflexota bacterium]